MHVRNKNKYRKKKAVEEKLPGYRAECHDHEDQRAARFLDVSQRIRHFKKDILKYFFSLMQIAPQNTHALYLLNQLPKCCASVLEINFRFRRSSLIISLLLLFFFFLKKKKERKILHILGNG